MLRLIEGYRRATKDVAYWIEATRWSDVADLHDVKPDSHNESRAEGDTGASRRNSPATEMGRSGWGEKAHNS